MPTPKIEAANPHEHWVFKGQNPDILTLFFRGCNLDDMDCFRHIV